MPEILNCKGEVKNPQDYYVVGLRKYGTTVGHVLCVILCTCMLFFNIEAWWLALMAHDSTDSQDLPQEGLGLPQL